MQTLYGIQFKPKYPMNTTWYLTSKKKVPFTSLKSLAKTWKTKESAEQYLNKKIPELAAECEVVILYG